MTVGNRMNVDDPRDPGGRLGTWSEFIRIVLRKGPYKGKGDPDLRNLDLLHCGCNDGDILILGKHLLGLCASFLTFSF